MKKTFFSIITIIFGVLAFYPCVTNAEIIRSFSSDITVMPDSSLVIKEKIVYDFENALRHGIYRDIPLKNKEGENIEIEVLSVTDKDDKPQVFTTSTKNQVLNIKIGDNGVIISGEKGYNITYKVFGAVDYYEDFDEVYWNVTGNEWNVPIEFSEVSITLPKDVFPKERKCYFGPSGSKTSCKVVDDKTYQVEKVLAEGEGMTVAVALNKGAVSEYQHKTDNKLLAFLSIFWPAFLPVIVFCFMFYRWHRKGRDPKGKGIIKPEYLAPEDLSPVEVGGIMHEAIKPRSISAQIIDLAIRGFIKIKPIENKLLGFSYKQDYELTLLVEIGFLDNDFDKEIIKTMFGDNPTVGGVTMLSALNNLFYKSVSKISGLVIDSLLKKKYYFNFPKNNWSITIILLGLLVVQPIGLIIMSNQTHDPRRDIIFISSFIFSIGIALIFQFLMPSKTKKGVLMREYLLGLKEYLQIVEKDRLVFHNAPEKKPEVFEALLPYAIVFGVEELWAKEFNDIYKTNPEWFENSGGNFNTANFGKELSTFGTVLISSISSTPHDSSSSSGSSGVSSGSSGGGHGGGGGGSW